MYTIVTEWVGNKIKSDCRAADEIEAIEKLAIVVAEGYADAFYALTPIGDCAYWVVDPVAKTLTFDASQNMSDKIDNLLSDVKIKISGAMSDRLKQGIIWKYNNGGTPYSISIDEGMQKLFSYTATLRGEGRTNSHAGKVRQGNVEFNINDTGMEELSIFAGEWGLAIQRKSWDAEDAVTTYVDTHTDVENVAYLESFNPLTIDWTIDWSQDPQNNGKGWTDDTVLQVP